MPWGRAGHGLSVALPGKGLANSDWADIEVFRSLIITNSAWAVSTVYHGRLKIPVQQSPVAKSVLRVGSPQSRRLLPGNRHLSYQSHRALVGREASWWSSPCSGRPRSSNGSPMTWGVLPWENRRERLTGFSCIVVYTEI